MIIKYFKFKGSPEKNFPLISNDGVTYEMHNMCMGDTIIFKGTYEECHKFYCDKILLGSVIELGGH